MNNRCIKQKTHCIQAEEKLENGIEQNSQLMHTLAHNVQRDIKYLVVHISSEYYYNYSKLSRAWYGSVVFWWDIYFTILSGSLSELGNFAIPANTLRIVHTALHRPHALQHAGENNNNASNGFTPICWTRPDRRCYTVQSFSV